MCANLCDAVESPVHVAGTYTKYNVVKCNILVNAVCGLSLLHVTMKTVVDNLRKKQFY